MKQQKRSIIAGQNLNKLIKEKPMTQWEAAEILGFSDDRQVRRLIKGGIRNIDEIERIAHCFGVPFERMINGNAD